MNFGAAGQPPAALLPMGIFVGGYGTNPNYTGHKYGPVIQGSTTTRIIRAKGTPIYKATPPQVATSNLTTILDQIWHTGMTAAQQNAWQAWGQTARVPAPNGRLKPLNGVAAFIQCNRPRLQFNFNVVIAAPTTPGRPTYTQPQYYLFAPGGNLYMIVSAQDAWFGDPASNLYMWLGQPTSGTAWTPTERYSPYTVLHPADFTANGLYSLGPIVPGNIASRNMWIRTSVATSDIRLSAP